ncbi:hypothetical protein Tco_1411760 [Tanacetum coccineum]
MADINNMTMEEYLARTRTDHGEGVLKGIPFSGTDKEDDNEHINNVLEIADIIHIPKVTKDHAMLRIFPMTLVGEAQIWMRIELNEGITTWDTMKSRSLARYCPPSKIAKQIQEIHNFKQEVDETLYTTWERQMVDMLGPIPKMTHAKGKKAIQYMADHSRFGTMNKFTERVNAVRIKEVMYEKFNGPPFTSNASRNKQGVPGFYTKNENMPGKDEGVTPLEKYLLKFIEEFTKKQDELDELVEKSNASIKIEINNIEASLKRLDDRVDQLIKVVKHERYRTSTINLGKNYITNNISSIGVSFVEQVSQATSIKETNEQTPRDFLMIKPYVKPYEPLIPYPHRLIEEEDEYEQTLCLERATRMKINKPFVNKLKNAPKDFQELKDAIKRRPS